MVRTARRQLERRHLLLENIFEDELNIDEGKHVLAMFLK